LDWELGNDDDGMGWDGGGTWWTLSVKWQGWFLICCLHYPISIFISLFPRPTHCKYFRFFDAISLVFHMPDDKGGGSRGSGGKVGYITDHFVD